MEHSPFDRDRFFQTILDAFPSPVLVVDSDLRIIEFNKAASQLIPDTAEPFIIRQGGEVLHCINYAKMTGGCGSSVACKSCIIKNSVEESYRGGNVVRAKARMKIVKGEETSKMHLLITTKPFEYKDIILTLLILEDITELVELKSLIPICANCKKIRDDHQYWESLESYLNEHFDMNFTHSICPECAKKLYPEYYKSRRQ